MAVHNRMNRAFRRRTKQLGYQVNPSRESSGLFQEPLQFAQRKTNKIGYCMDRTSVKQSLDYAVRPNSNTFHICGCRRPNSRNGILEDKRFGWRHAELFGGEPKNGRVRLASG